MNPSILRTAMLGLLVTVIVQPIVQPIPGETANNERTPQEENTRMPVQNILHTQLQNKVQQIIRMFPISSRIRHYRSPNQHADYILCTCFLFLDDLSLRTLTA